MVCRVLNELREGFNPRLPGGRRPQPTSKMSSSREFQSTPSGGKATLRGCAAVRVLRVSIHAFRGEGDGAPVRRGVPSLCFNPRLPGGRRRNRCVECCTPRRCFNPRLPGGRRPSRTSVLFARRVFQSTPSGGKATASLSVHSSSRSTFQSTPSGGKATKRTPSFRPRASVSIHAFRGEGDRVWFVTSKQSGAFQSTPSGGKATTPLISKMSSSREFQSTPSGGKATRSAMTERAARQVSIHAFRGEGDRNI